MFKDKRFFIGAIVLVFLLIAAFFFFGEKGGSSSKAGGGVNLVAVGEIPSLAQAMKKDSVLRRKVKELLSYDASYVFENHAQVNGIIVEILFRWSGLSGSALENISGARGVEYFLRAHHGLPDDEPIFNNPYLGENPWPKLFQRYRARLLMQGSAAQIFDGTAYYGAALGKFVVEGPISGKFVQGFLNVVKEQPLKERQKQVRNFLVFIDEVKGLKNLSDQDNRTLQSLYDALKA